MRLTSLEYGSLLCYCPRPTSKEMRDAYDVMLAIKGDTYVDIETHPILMSEWIARAIQERLSNLPFADFFRQNPRLIPVPKSSLMLKDTLWVPFRIATALAKGGVGIDVDPCLIRVSAVRKAALSKAWDRPKPKEHYESLRVQTQISGPPPREILMVDDIITRGSTLMGAANRLVEAFPGTRIRAFGAMTTFSQPSDFVALSKPLIGTIQYRPSKEDTIRRP